MRMFAVGFVLAFGFGSMLVGCGSIRGDRSQARPPSAVAEEFLHEASTHLLPAATLTSDMVLRQRVTVQWPEGEERFDAVLQKRGDALLLIGLGPMNAVGFTLSLDPRGVTFENQSGRALPFEAERILADVQRVFYPWLDELPACLGCTRRGQRDDFVIVEKYGAATLEERTFSISDHPDAGTLSVHYWGWSPDLEFPQHVVLENRWAGYTLIIETLEAEALD